MIPRSIFLTIFRQLSYKATHSRLSTIIILTYLQHPGKHTVAHPIYQSLISDCLLTITLLRCYLIFILFVNQ